jgi:RimJ/RimL family protein N-acetyltransferase
MRFRKVFSYGKILDFATYERLQVLDTTCPFFKGCTNEFKQNRDWWVMLDTKGQIIAYCGAGYNSDFSLFVRAWVDKRYRGKGLQKRMIALRLKAAKARYCNMAITYITPDNPASGNSLIACGFRLYTPEWAYAGKEMIYFRLDL